MHFFKYLKFRNFCEEKISMVQVEKIYGINVHKVQKYEFTKVQKQETTKVQFYFKSSKHDTKRLKRKI